MKQLSLSLNAVATIEAIKNEYAEATAHIDTLTANAPKKSILAQALFLNSGYSIRATDGKARAEQLQQRALHAAWDAVVDVITNDDPQASDMAMLIVGETFYDCDYCETLFSPFRLSSAYEDGLKFNTEKRKALATLNDDNIAKLYEVMRVPADIDYIALSRFLNSTGGSHTTSANKFKKSLVYRGTARTYSTDHRAHFAAILRIYSSAKGLGWKNADILKAVNGIKLVSAFHGENFDSIEKYAEVFSMTQSANGNAKITFTAEAVRVLNDVMNGREPINTKEEREIFHRMIDDMNAIK